MESLLFQTTFNNVYIIMREHVSEHSILKSDMSLGPIFDFVLSTPCNLDECPLPQPGTSQLLMHCLPELTFLLCGGEDNTGFI